MIYRLILASLGRIPVAAFPSWESGFFVNKPIASPLLQVDGLGKTFGSDSSGLSVLRSISLELSHGEIAAIIGPSGCGKSTFFNILAGLISPDQGQIVLEGQHVSHLRGRVAYMQQKDLLLPWRNTLDNAILGMEIQRKDKDTARQQARDLLKTFGLEGFEAHYPQELSGGMRQRVALMRTILCQKDILLLDEPFGALDAITRRTMQSWFLQVWSRFGHSVLLITHDVEEALLLADRVYVLAPRPAFTKESIPVPFQRPRRITQLDMVKLKESLLGLLEQEITPAQL